MKQLSIIFKKNGLGKLPVDILTDREHFLINLWKSFQANGIASKVSNGIKNNDIPTKTVEELVSYIKNNFGLDATYLPKETKKIIDKGSDKYGKYQERIIEKVISERIKVQVNDKQTVTFEPYLLATLIYDIRGA